jgi:hypothetical protein
LGVDLTFRRWLFRFRVEGSVRLDPEEKICAAGQIGAFVRELLSVNAASKTQRRSRAKGGYEHVEALLVGDRGPPAPGFGYRSRRVTWEPYRAAAAVDSQAGVLP